MRSSGGSSGHGVPKTLTLRAGGRSGGLVFWAMSDYPRVRLIGDTRARATGKVKAQLESVGVAWVDSPCWMRAARGEYGAYIEELYAVCAPTGYDGVIRMPAATRPIDLTFQARNKGTFQQSCRLEWTFSACAGVTKKLGCRGVLDRANPPSGAPLQPKRLQTPHWC